MYTGGSSITFDPAWISRLSIEKLKKKKTIVHPGFQPIIKQTNYIGKGFSLNQLQKSSFASALAKPIGENVFIGDFLDNFRLNILEVHNLENITLLLFQKFRGGKDKKVNCGCR